jgi:hypothetical protein
MTAEATPNAMTDPGWSNAPPDDGISSIEPPPEPIDMHEPGWSNTEPPAPPPIVATGATAGAPGSWTPAGAVAPADFAALGGITALPQAAWTTGQHMVLGDASHAYWNATAWAVGEAA